MLEAEGEEPMWVNALLLSTLVAEGKRLAVQTARFFGDPDPHWAWVSDLQGIHETRFASWRGRKQPPSRTMPRLKYCLLKLPVAGAKYVMALSDIQAACEFHSKTNAGKRWYERVKKWEDLCVQVGVPAAHVCRPCSQDELGFVRLGSHRCTSFSVWPILADSWTAGAKKDPRDREAAQGTWVWAASHPEG